MEALTHRNLGLARCQLEIISQLHQRMPDSTVVQGPKVPPQSCEVDVVNVISLIPCVLAHLQSKRSQAASARATIPQKSKHLRSQTAGAGQPFKPSLRHGALSRWRMNFFSQQ